MSDSDLYQDIYNTSQVIWNETRRLSKLIDAVDHSRHDLIKNMALGMAEMELGFAKSRFETILIGIGRSRREDNKDNG